MRSFYGTRTHNPLLESFAVCVFNGRRCGIRTPIQAPKASVLPLHYILYNGAHSWIRTSDLRVISTLLYRLSYASIFGKRSFPFLIDILYHIFFKKSNNFFWPRQLLWFFVALPAELLPNMAAFAACSSPTPPCQVNWVGRLDSNQRHTDLESIIKMNCCNCLIFMYILYHIFFKKSNYSFKSTSLNLKFIYRKNGINLNGKVI